jgi:signal transduction histidine kinase
MRETSFPPACRLLHKFTGADAMSQAESSAKLPADRLLESVTRTLRHEVGDLLQTVYSTVAILQERIPRDSELERRFLSDLRCRAETCKDELDAVHDLVLPVTLSIAPTDMAELSALLVASFSRRNKSVDIRAEPSPPLTIEADSARLTQVGRLMLAAACQAARRRVVVETRPATGNSVRWTITHDGHAATTEQLAWLATPFATTQQALSGLALALARKVAELHGGTVSAENQGDEGFRVAILLPRQPRLAPT